MQEQHGQQGQQGWQGQEGQQGSTSRGQSASPKMASRIQVKSTWPAENFQQFSSGAPIASSVTCDKTKILLRRNIRLHLPHPLPGSSDGDPLPVACQTCGGARVFRAATSGGQKTKHQLKLDFQVENQPRAAYIGRKALVLIYQGPSQQMSQLKKICARGGGKTRTTC